MANQLPERTPHPTGIGETGAPGHLAQGSPAGADEGLSQRDALAQHVMIRRHPERSLEGSYEVALAQTGRASEVAERQGPVDPLGYDSTQTPDLFVGQSRVPPTFFRRPLC